MTNDESNACGSKPSLAEGLTDRGPKKPRHERWKVFVPDRLQVSGKIGLMILIIGDYANWTGWYAGLGSDGLMILFRSVDMNLLDSWTCSSGDGPVFFGSFGRSTSSPWMKLQLSEDTSV